MTRLAFGLAAGAVFGGLAAASMLKLSFPDKRAALAGAFVERFGIGLVIPLVNLDWPAWAIGLAFGLLLSAPSAIITKAWAPILGLGAVGGLLIGVILPHALT